MRIKWMIWLAGLSTVVLMSTPQVAQANGFSVGFEIRHVRDFYEPLGSHGYWVETHGHGRCWYPAYQDHGWRPYTDGYWTWTDSGWYWVSDEPWAWATYHYGRWVWDEYYGWVWVPGTEWAPAWVSWRSGDGYIGWAPLPPGCDFDPFDNVLYFERIVIPWHAYVFVEHRHFCHRIRPSVIVVNQTIVHKTINITKVQRVNNIVVNNGPSVRVVEREAGRKFDTVPAIDVRRAELKRFAELPKVTAPPRRDKDERPEKPRTPVIIRGTERDEPLQPVRRPSDDTPKVQPRRDHDTPAPVLKPAPEVRAPYTPMPKRSAVVQRDEPGHSPAMPPGQMKRTAPAPKSAPVVSEPPRTSPGEGRKVGQERRYDEGTLSGSGRRQGN